MAYSFDATRGETADEIKRRRAWAQALLDGVGAGAVPTTVGGGIAEIGDAIAGLVAKKRSDKMDREGTAAAMKAAGGNSYIRDLLLGNVGGGGAEISGTGGASTLAGSAGRDKLGPISPDLSARADYIREAAARIGVDPEIAVRVARSEGLAKGVWQSNYHKNGKRETSYGPFQLLVGGGLGDKFIRETGLDPRDPSTERAQVDFALRQAKAGGWSPWYGAAKVGVGKWDGIQRGNNALPGGEGNDMLMDGWGQPDPNRPGHGINTQTGAPSSFSQPDPARYGPPVAPKGDRLPDPNAMPQFNPMMAQGPLGPQMAPQMAQGMPQQPPVPQPRPQMAPPVDSMQTAAVPQPMMRPRGIVSPRAEDNGYVSGPGAAMQQPGGQGGGLLGRLLSRQPMPSNSASNSASPAQSGAIGGTGGQATAPGGGGNDELMQMYALIDNPLLPESYRAAIIDAIKQKQEQADPAYKADLAYKEAQTKKLQQEMAGGGAPSPTADMQEYQYAVQTGAFKGTFTDWQTKGVRDQDVGFSREQGLRKEYTASPEYKRFDDVRASYERVRAGAQRDSGAGDLSLIFGFMKMLDPGSVVREGEFANAENTAGVPDRIRNLYNRVVSGERLQPGQRQEFVSTAGDLYSQEATRIGSLNERYTGIASGYQIDPSRVIVTPQQYDPLNLLPPEQGQDQQGVKDYREYFGGGR